MIPRISLFFLISMVLVGPAFGQNPEAEREFALAADHYRNSRWKLATERFEKLIQSYPADSRSKLATFFLGEAALQTQDYQKSKSNLNQFLTAFPNHNLSGRAKFRLGECYYLLGEDQQAINVLKESEASANGKDYREFSRLYLGEMLQKKTTQQELRLALNYLHQGLKEYPGSPLSDRYRLSLAKCYQKTGQHNQATRFYNFLVNSSDAKISSQARISNASMAIGNGKWNDAKSLLSDTALGTFQIDTRPEAHYWRGRAEMGTKNWAAAAKYLALASGSIKDPLLAQAAHYDAAVSYLQINEHQKASRLLEQSIRKWPSGRWISGVSFLYVDTAKKRGENKEVIRRAQTIPKNIYRTNQWAMIQETAGRAAFGSKDFRTAQSYFQNAVNWANNPQVRSQPAQRNFASKWAPTWIYLLGLTQLNAGETKLGLLSMQKVVDLTKQSVSSSRNSENSADSQKLWLYTNSQYSLTSHLVKEGNWKQAAIKNEQLLKTPLAQDLKIKILADQLKCYGMLQDSQKLTLVQQQLRQLKVTGPSSKLVAYARKQQDRSALRIAQSNYQNKNWEEAAKWFRIASSSSDQEIATKGLSGLAWCQFRTDRDGLGSTTALQALIDRFPNSSYTAEAIVYRANQLLDGQQLTKAKALLEGAEDRFDGWPRKDQIFALLAKVDVAQGGKRRVEKATQRLQSAIDLQLKKSVEDQDSGAIASYQYQLAWALIDLKRDQSANRQFQDIYKKYPNSRFWPEAAFRAGESWYKSGKIKEAETAWKRVLNAKATGHSISDDVHAHTLFMLAMVAVRKSNWEEVENWCAKISEQSPNHPLVHQAGYWEAESQYRMSKYKKSIDKLLKVVPRTNGVKMPWAGMSHLRLAQGFAQLGQWDDALEVALEMERKFDKFPLQFEVDCLIGRAYAIDGGFDLARKHYQKVIQSPKGKRTETAAMAQWLIGESYFHQEKYELAAEAYHRCNTLYPYQKWKAISLLQAGKCYEHLGRPEAAIGYFRQIVRQHGGSSLAANAQKRLAKLGVKSEVSGQVADQSQEKNRR